MKQDIDFMSLINKIIYTYDEFIKKEGFAVNDIVEGLKGISPKFNKFSQNIDSLTKQ